MDINFFLKVKSEFFNLKIFLKLIFNKQNLKKVKKIFSLQSM